MAQKSGLVQGTLDMLVLRVLSRGEFHGWGITQKLEQLSKNALRVEEGSLYPALYPDGGEGLAQIRVEANRKGSAREILYPHSHWMQTARGRKRELGAIDWHNRAGDGGALTAWRLPSRYCASPP